MTVPRNLIGGVLTILIGVGYLAMTLNLRTSALADTVGPAGFPKVLAYALIGLGLVLCAQSLFALRARSAAVPAMAADLPEDAEAERGSGLSGVLRAAGLLVLGILYLLVIRWLGYVPSVALLMIASAVYLGTPFSARVVGIGVAGAVVYWLVFVLLLGIPLPGGVIADLF